MTRLDSIKSELDRHATAIAERGETGKLTLRVNVTQGNISRHFQIGFEKTASVSSATAGDFSLDNGL